MTQFRRDVAGINIHPAAGGRLPSGVAPTMTGPLYHVVASAERYALQPMRLANGLRAALSKVKTNEPGDCRYAQAQQ